MLASLDGMSQLWIDDGQQLTRSRRTGVTLDQRPLDHTGIEEISGIFSSPRKSSPLKNIMVLEQVDEAGELILCLA
jgi:hypothetical protein